MIIDCGACSLRNLGCDDCVVTALADAAKAGTSLYGEICMNSTRFELGADECAAIEVLADAGLSPDCASFRVGKRKVLVTGSRSRRGAVRAESWGAGHRGVGHWTRAMVVS